MTDRGRQQAEILSAIGRYVKAHHIPPLDRGLRSIVVQQTANLLNGGWPIEEIRAAALELVARYDRFNGHKELLGLQRRLEVADEERQEARHAEHKEIERAEGIDPTVAMLIARRRRPHPRSHAFKRSDRADMCGFTYDGELLCDGPLGVHVREVGLDPEGQPILVANGVAS